MRHLLLYTMLLCGPSYSSDTMRPEDNPGVKLFEAARYAEAEQYFIDNLNAENELKQLSHRYLAKYAILKNEGKTAIKHIESALLIPPNSSTELMVAAKAYCTQAMQVSIFKALKLGKKCGKYYSQAADIEGSDTDALKQAVFFHLQAPSLAGGSKSMARQYLSRLHDISEEDSRFAHVLLTEHDAGKQEAQALADRYAELDYKKPENLYDLALFYRDRDMPNKAMDLLLIIVNKQSPSPGSWHQTDAMFQLGELYIQAGDKIEDGIALVERYLDSSYDQYDRHYFWARLRLARAYQLIGKQEKYSEIVNVIKAQDYSHDKHFAKAFDKLID